MGECRMIKRIHTININLPFWLEWARRFIRLDVKQYKLPNKIKGMKADGIIFDEIVDEGFKHKNIIITSTPKGNNSFEKLMKYRRKSK